MTRELPHLTLPVWDEPIRRRLSGGGSYVERDHKEHGAKLLDEADELRDTFAARRAEAPEGIQPRLIFKLQLHKKGQLDDDTIAQLGLRLVSREPDQVIVVFPDDETLAELGRKLGAYSEESRYKGLGAIEQIAPIEPEDRIGPRLAREPIDLDEIVPLDVELWHTGRERSREQVEQLDSLLSARGGRVSDSWIGETLCLMRVHAGREVMEELSRQDFVREIERRPDPAFDMLEVVRLRLGDLDVAGAVNLDELPGVVIMDSGLATGHPLLANIVGDAQNFASDDFEGDVTGHGTSVAGLAAYGDVAKCIDDRAFAPTAAVYSARVLDANNLYDEEKLVENQLRSAVEYFLENYPGARVFNLSIGAAEPADRSRHQSRLAATIDEIAYLHRDRELIFVVSTGNFWPPNEAAEEMLDTYPDYLLEMDEARLVDPATAAIAVTVGGVSFGIGRDLRMYAETDVIRPIAGEPLLPSPFTRVGPGVQGAIKPELVDLAGDLSFERGRITEAASVGTPTLSHLFAPPDGRLLHTVAGTSFAAPRVANVVARLMYEFPGISSNLVRALVACSAAVPPTRPAAFADANSDATRRVYGFGMTDFVRASRSAENDVLLLFEGTIPLDEFQLFQVPPIPDDFMDTAGERILSVALAFDPPTRHTRADSYLGTSMQFALYRNVAPDEVADGLRVWAKEELAEDAEPPDIGNDGGLPHKIALQPGVNTLKRGCLQKASFRIARPAVWRYDGGELVLAVICRRKWAPVEIESQRYAVAVELSHSDEEIDLHARISQRVQQFERVRISV